MIVHVGARRWPEPLSSAFTALGHEVGEFEVRNPFQLQRWTHARWVVTVSARTLPLLAASRKVAVELDAPILEDLERRRFPSIAVEGARSVLTRGIERASVVVARSEAALRHAEAFLGAKNIELLRDPIEIRARRSRTRAKVRQELGLPEAMRLVAIAEPIAADTPLEPLMFALRSLAGVGVLIPGGGPRDGEISAMAMIARPSSPVLVYEPSTANLERAVDAADLVLDLGSARPATLASRRIVTLGHGLLSLIASDPASEGIVAHVDPDPAQIASAVHEGLSMESFEVETTSLVRAWSWLGRAERYAAILERLG